MSVLHEVACGACGRRHVMSAARARATRVLRCECGAFVRLDRALGEARSEPPPASPPTVSIEQDDEEDSETHMLSSLDAFAALASTPRSSSPPKARPSSPLQRLPPPARRTPPAPARSPSAPPPRPSSPMQQAPSSPPNGKPLWYVDLGGAETMEMTIEQLIIARRSGKLGEGALVWRTGMPHWRPIGTLIPGAASNPPKPSAPTSSPPPAATPSAAPTAERGGDPMSFERPLATLEFALENSAAPTPREPSVRWANPSRPAASSQPPRARSSAPAPRVTGRGTLASLSQVGPLPAPARLPSQVGHLPPRPSPSQVGPLPAPAPLPSPSAPPTRRVSSIPPAPLPPRTPPPRSIQPIVQANAELAQSPRWLSVAMAALICIAASASGAFVVHALKVRHQPLSLAPTVIGTSATLTSPNLVATAEATATASAQPEVVNLDSLSVEHPVPRATSKPVSAAASAAPAVIAFPDPPQELPPQEPPAKATAASTAPPAVTTKPKPDELPAAAQSNPYSTAAPVDSAPKKTNPSSSDQPGF